MLRDKIRNTKQNSKYIVASLFILYFAVDCLAQEDFIYNAKEKRNPFIPLVTSDGRLLKLEQEEGPTGLALEGIIYDEHGVSYCMVNGQVVKIGDMIGDFQVLKIEKDKVVFIKEGEPLEVPLKKEEE